MGVRLNISANPPVRTGLEPPEPAAAPAGVVAPDPRPVGGGTAPQVGGAQSVTGGAGTPEPIQRPASPPAPRPEPARANPADQGPPAAEPAQPTQPQVNSAQTTETRPANAEAEAAPEPNSAPAVRLRNFRFFSAAESIRERDLEVRLNRLESELESVGRRLQSGDSFSMRTDAQLDSARLRSDLDMVQSQIARLRLQRVFGGPSAQMGATDAAVPAQQAAPAEAQPPALPASEEAQGLNLLA